MSVSNDGKCLLASCLDSKVRLLETDTGELLNAYSGHQATSMRAEGRLSHDDACVLSTSEDGRVVAWDIVQAVMLRQFKVRAAACFAVPSHLIRVFCVCVRSTADTDANGKLVHLLPRCNRHRNRCSQLQSHQLIIILMAGALNSHMLRASVPPLAPTNQPCPARLLCHTLSVRSCAAEWMEW